ncbi:unnamed protein product [Rhizoctonia solani]|uniref:F-box domain-containing protein n=1 Tax=Rhizoctonia solani TaxID=456999 RepID=A0A8H2W8H0_9AGAM|nr:unnamed protein product [Rhizoctonia solani]
MATMSLGRHCYVRVRPPLRTTMGTAAHTCFDDLSNEVILQILHSCSYKAILRFALTCKRSYDIVINSVSLRLHIELEVNDLEVVKNLRLKGGNPTSSSILEELNRYRNGHPKVLRWELHDSSYFKAYSSFGPQEYPDSLQIIPLDSAPLPTPVNFHTKFHRFAVDPGQDLAVLVAVVPERSNCIQLHIRSLITGQSHVQTRRPNLVVEFDFDISVLASATFHYAPEVLGSVLAIRFNSEAKRMYEILTWEWRSGTLLHRLSSRNGTSDARFIDSSYLAVFSASLRPTEGRLLRNIAISIYDISTPVSHDIEADSHFCISKYPILDPAMTFDFPKLRDSHSVFSIGFMARSDPVPGRIVYTDTVSFAHSRSATLGLVLSLFQHPVSQNNLGNIQEFRGFVNTSHLLDHLTRFRGSQDHPRALSWDQWGEQATRWFPENEVDLSCSQMSGSRYVSVKHGPNGLHGHHHLVITDFNTPIVQRHQASDHLLTPYSYKFERKGDNITLLHANGPTANRPTSPSADAPVQDNAVIIMTLGGDMPGTFDVGFEQVIVSRLPCRVIIRVKPEIPHDGWFLDGSRLIGIKNYFGEYPSLTIYDLHIPA